MSTSEYHSGSAKAMEDGYSSEEMEGETQAPQRGSEQWWLNRAGSCYRQSDDWFDGIRRQIEDNMDHFNSRHQKGSKYNHPAYKHRSKLFRPKSRSTSVKMEASASAAFFATQDSVTCVPPNNGDKQQVLAAAINAELLNYRLGGDIPWFITCIGALQDTHKQGVCISKQVWRYDEIEQHYEEDTLDDAGEVVFSEPGRTLTETVSDHPDVVLIPIENIRISPAADWRDPIQSSPYVIDIEAFYVDEILERANREHGEARPGEVPWRKVSRSDIRSAAQHDYDSIRQAREGDRRDRYDDVSTDEHDYDVVWVRHHVMRVGGEDWYFDTIGEEVLLSDPVPYRDVFPTTKRHYRIGFSTLETHKAYPAGKIEIAAPLQRELNDNTNLRIDAIRHVLSPRYFIKRGQSVDMVSLMRNTPGGITPMDNPNEDVKIRQISDPTTNAFQEQDRLQIEMDDLMGTFSGSSVGSNRQLNETVGGMELIAGDANQISEYSIRLFTETWVEPVLQQVMELEQALESDDMVLAICGMRHGVHPRIAFEMLKMPVKVKVDVGYGATNPMKRVEKVTFGFRSLAEIKPELVQKVDGMEVATEIFGALGFKNVERFWPEMGEAENPRVAELEGQVQELMGMLESDGQKHETQKIIAQIREQGQTQRLQMTLQAQDRRTMNDAEIKREIENNKLKVRQVELALERENVTLNRWGLVEQRRALNHQIMMDEAELRLRVQTIQQAPEPRPDGVVPSGSQPDTRAIGTGTKNRIAEAPDLPGNDKAGTIARDDYGDIPFKTG